MSVGNLAPGPERLHHMKRIGMLIAATALAAAACGGATTVSTTNPPDGAPEQLGRLAAAQQLWAQAAPADYTVTQVDLDDEESPHPQTVAVRDGEVVSLTGEPMSVDAAFTAIEESIRRGAEVTVEYDSKLGYPVRIDIDSDRDGVSDLLVHYADLATMPIVETLAELRAAQQRWEAQHLESYRFIFRFDCTCPESGTFQVDVEEGRVVDVIALDGAAEQSNLDPGFEIDDAFDDLAEWFADSAELIEEGILDVDVRTDPRYGYPRWFRIVAEDMDDEFFQGRFTMVVTIDLIAELDPAEPAVDLDNLDQLEIAKELWEEAALEDYRYVLTVHCMCPPEAAGPFEITVVDAKLDLVKLLGNDAAANAPVILIDEALRMIEDAIVEGTDVDVTYDPALGYPRLVIIDPEAVAVDGGLAFSITDFEVMQ